MSVLSARLPKLVRVLVQLPLAKYTLVTRQFGTQTWSYRRDHTACYYTHLLRYDTTDTKFQASSLASVTCILPFIVPLRNMR